MTTVAALVAVSFGANGVEAGNPPGSCDFCYPGSQCGSELQWEHLCDETCLGPGQFPTGNWATCDDNDFWCGEGKLRITCGDGNESGFPDD